jgi:hypothetical protein
MMIMMTTTNVRPYEVRRKAGESELCVAWSDCVLGCQLATDRYNSNTLKRMTWNKSRYFRTKIIVVSKIEISFTPVCMVPKSSC